MHNLIKKTQKKLNKILNDLNIEMNAEDKIGEEIVYQMQSGSHELIAFETYPDYIKEYAETKLKLSIEEADLEDEQEEYDYFIETWESVLKNYEAVASYNRFQKNLSKSKDIKDIIEMSIDEINKIDKISKIEEMERKEER